MPQDPIDLLERVHDEGSLLEFLSALAAEHQTRRDESGWENDSIHAFLAAAVRWGEESTRGLPLAGYAPCSNPWRRCADIIYAGKVYE
jgi:hypothetical protein